MDTSTLRAMIRLLDDTDEDVVEAAELGYCELLHFKCAASRTCDAWLVGGPISDEMEDD